MDAVFELLPLALGAMFVPVLMRYLALAKGSLTRLLAMLAISALVGFVGSALNGEQKPMLDLAERLAAFILDSAAAFAGASVVEQVWVMWRGTSVPQSA